MYFNVLPTDTVSQLLHFNVLPTDTVSQSLDFNILPTDTVSQPLDFIVLSIARGSPNTATHTENVERCTKTKTPLSDALLLRREKRERNKMAIDLHF